MFIQQVKYFNNKNILTEPNFFQWRGIVKQSQNSEIKDKMIIPRSLNNNQSIYQNVKSATYPKFYQQKCVCKIVLLKWLVHKKNWFGSV